jgi:molybdenum cofactor sulfurtransferase
MRIDQWLPSAFLIFALNRIRSDDGLFECAICKAFQRMSQRDSAIFVFTRNLLNIGSLILVVAIIFLLAYRETNSLPLGIDPPSSPERTSFSMDQPSYEDNILSIRGSFLPRLRNVTYLDHATLPLFPDSALNNFSDHLHTSLFGNTHSESPSAEMSTNTIESARLRVLQFLGTKLTKHSLIFTSSSGHALKTVLQAFPFNASRALLLGLEPPRHPRAAEPGGGEGWPGGTFQYHR